MAPPLNAPDLGAAEDRLISAVAGGPVVRAFGSDALWRAAAIGDRRSPLDGNFNGNGNGAR